MKLFKLDRGEACSNYSSDYADWETSAYFINLDCVSYLEERRHETPNGHTTSWYLHLGSTDLELKKAAFDRIHLALDSR